MIEMSVLFVLKQNSSGGLQNPKDWEDFGIDYGKSSTFGRVG